MVTLKKVNIVFLFLGLYLSLILTLFKCYYINLNDTLLIQIVLIISVLAIYYYYIDTFGVLFQNFGFISILFLNIILCAFIFSLSLELIFLIKGLMLNDLSVFISQNKSTNIIDFLKSLLINKVDCLSNEFQVVVAGSGEGGVIGEGAIGEGAIGEGAIGEAVPAGGAIFILRPLFLGIFSFCSYLLLQTPVENINIMADVSEQVADIAQTVSQVVTQYDFCASGRLVVGSIGISISQAFIVINSYTPQINQFLPYRILRNVIHIRSFVRRRPLLSLILLSGSNFFVINQ
jgi:hypothetical protein